MGEYEVQRRAEQATPGGEPAAVEVESPVRQSLRGTTYEEGVQMLAPGAGAASAVQMDATPEPAADAAPETTPEEEAAKREEEERVAAAKASWEALMGETLGSFLFDQIREHVSVDDLLGYAKQGTQAMADNLGSLGDLVGSAGENWDGAAVTKFLEALAPKLQEMADGWLAGESGAKVRTAIAQWVEESPGGVTAIAASIGVVAIGAAVAAYLADMDVPEFGHTFKIGDTGLSAGGTIDLGTLQNLAVQAATLTVRYQREGLDIHVTGNYDDEEGFSASLGMKGEADLGGAGLTGTGNLTVKEDGTVLVEVAGGIKTVIAGTPVEASLEGKQAETASVGGSLVIGDAGMQQRLSGTFDLDTSLFTLQSEVGSDLLRYTQGLQMGEEGLTSTRGLKLSHGTSMLSYNETSGPGGDGSTLRAEDSSIGGSGVSAYGQVGTGTQEGFQLGAGYRNDILKTQFDLAMGETSTLSHSTELNTPDGLTAGYSAKLDLDDGVLTDFSAKFGFRDPDEFRGFLLSYKAQWLGDNQQYQHQVDGMLEQSFGIVNTRLSGSLTFRDDGVQGGSIEALAGVPVGGDFQVLAGLGYEAMLQDEMMMHRPQISAGLQYKSVNLLLDWQPPVDGSMPDAGIFGLRAVIPLGR